MFEDNEVVSDGFLDRCTEIMGLMVPFVTMLNDICMPDDGSEESSGEEDVHEDDDNEDEEN